jgi:hypothetical protein
MYAFPPIRINVTKTILCSARHGGQAHDQPQSLHGCRLLTPSALAPNMEETRSRTPLGHASVLPPRSVSEIWKKDRKSQLQTLRRRKNLYRHRYLYE